MRPQKMPETERGRVAAGGQIPAVVTLELPAPPSVNAMFRNTPRGRAETPVYRDWKGHAGWRLKAQRPQSVPGQVLLILNCERMNVLADIDNRVKAVLDLLVDHDIIDDDRHVLGFAAAWAPPRDALMRVAIIPAADLSLQFQLASDRVHGGWFLHAPQPEQETATWPNHSPV